MPRINILNSSIYNRISAGEVVENPAAVVKELVENSIDAKATMISIEVKGGGIKEISVNDNGCGIEYDDLSVAFLPHSTSKISSVEDLDSIETLGFRGEALTSIAAVAMVTLRSKTKNSETGGLIEINGGKIEQHRPEASPDGTYITVRNLFYNTPARAKFLRSQKREETEIRNIISRIILANPTVSIKYNVDGKNVFYSTGKNLESAFAAVYGINELNKYYAVHSKRQGISVYGYISMPEENKPNKTYQTSIVNGRYVISPLISSAVQNAYGDTVMKRTFPAYVLFIDTDSRFIDVNVHPRKLDIKFSDSNNVFSVIMKAVSDALYGKIAFSNTDLNSERVDKTNESNTIVKSGVSGNSFNSLFSNENNKVKNDAEYPNISDNNAEIEKNSVFSRLIESNTFLDDKMLLKAGENLGKGQILENIFINLQKDNNVDVNKKDFNGNIVEYSSDHADNVKQINGNYLKNVQEEFSIEPEIKFIGIIFNTYLLFESENHLYLIDQHAAHERILYDKLSKEFEQHTIISQPMIIPYCLNLNSLEFNYIFENISLLRSFGFEIEEFGDNTLRVLTVPLDLADISLNKFFDNFLKNINSFKKADKTDYIKDKIMQAACKAAIKGGDILSDDDVKLLIKEISVNKRVLYCPHGRPIIVEVLKDEIEKKFKRT